MEKEKNTSSLVKKASDSQSASVWAKHSLLTATNFLHTACFFKVAKFRFCCNSIDLTNSSR